jgi:hypothetical protein
MTRHSRLTGAIAIAAAMLLIVSALVRWKVSHPSLPSSAVPSAGSSLVTAGANAGDSGPSSPNGKPTSPDPGTQNSAAAAVPDAANHTAARSPLDSLPVANAFDQLKQRYDRLQTDAAAPAGAAQDTVAATDSALPRRPAPLTPPPGAAARTSGVMQWTGSRGDTIEINGNSASKGTLTGDALPGVPVKITIENDDGTVVQLPSDADGYRMLTLRMASGRARIHWQTLGTGQTK